MRYPRTLITPALSCLMAGLAWGPATTANAQPANYRLDPVHTRVAFAVEHAGFSKAIGTVSGSTGSLLFDPDDWTRAELQVEIPMQRVDLGDEAWNKATLARNLLDAERFPVATFVSTRIEPIDPQRATVSGILTLRGVSREVDMDVVLNAVKRHPMPPFRRTAGFSATLALDRADFGIDAWPTMIGNRVELRIEAEAIRSGRIDGTDPVDTESEAPAPALPDPPPTDPLPVSEPTP